MDKSRNPDPANTFLADVWKVSADYRKARIRAYNVLSEIPNGSIPGHAPAIRILDAEISILDQMDLAQPVAHGLSKTEVEYVAFSSYSYESLKIILYNRRMAYGLLTEICAPYPALSRPLSLIALQREIRHITKLIMRDRQYTPRQSLPGQTELFE